jgi:hypothetical protein
MGFSAATRSLILRHGVFCETPKLGDVFDVLTYRERYEDLLAETRHKGVS